MKKVFEEMKSPKNLAGMLSIAILIAFYMLLDRISILTDLFVKVKTVLSPLIGAAVVAYLLYHIVAFFRTKVFGKMKRRKAAHIISVVISLVLAIAFVTLMVATILPQLVSSVSVMFSNSEKYLATFESWLIRLDRSIEFIDIDTKTVAKYWENLMDNVLTWIKDNSQTIIDTTYHVGSGLVSGILVFFLVIYMLLDCDSITDRISRVFRAFMKKESYEKFHAFAVRADHVFMTFLGENAFDALIVGILNFIFMTLMGMSEYAVLISAIAGLTNFIPSVGPIIGMLINALILIVSDPLNTVWFIIWSVILQTIDGNVVKPILFQKGTSVKPLWVLVSIVVGGKLAGITGMILAIPVFSLLSEGFNSMVDRRLANESNNSENID